MIRALAIIAALSLTACTSTPEVARHRLVGMTLPDLMACAGQPSERMQVGPDDYVLTETPMTVSTPSVSGSVPLLGDLVKPTVSASASASCRMIARVQSGRVVSLHFVGTSSLVFGAESACAPIVRDCLKHPDVTALSAGYRDADYLRSK